MHIGDMLHIVGALKLKEFEWGSALVSLFNERLQEHVVNESHLLTVEHTGIQARAALYNLPATELAALIVLHFDPGSRTVHERPVAPAFDIAVPAPPSHIPEPQPVHAPEPSKSRVLMAVSVTMLVVALMFSMYTAATVEGDVKPDQSMVETLSEVLQDVFKSYLEIHHSDGP